MVSQRGSGKTDTAKELAMKLRENFDKILIFDEEDLDVWHTMETHAHPEWTNINITRINEAQFKVWNKGLARMVATDPDLDQYFNLFNRFGRNMLLIIEDASRYLEGKIPPELKKLIYNTKQKNIDVLLIFHNLSEVPPRLARNCNVIIMGHTLDASVPTKLDHPKIRSEFERLKRQPRNPEGVPLDPFEKTVIIVN